MPITALEDKAFNIVVSLHHQETGETSHYELPISHVFDRLLLHYVPDDFTVLSDVFEAVASDDQGETLAGGIRLLDIKGELTVFMAQFFFDTYEGGVGPFKRVVLYRGSQDNADEVATLQLPELVNILMPVLEEIVRREKKRS